MSTNDKWFHDLFINEAKAVSGKLKNIATDDQVEAAVNKYLDENPVQPASAKVEDGVFVVT